MVDQTAELTLDEFARLYEQEGAFEVIDGERIAVSPIAALHSLIVKRLYAALLKFEESSGAGEFFSETPFVLTDTSDWVRGSRVPDVMFFRAERLADYRATMPDWKRKPYVLVPDLVVEVVSPTDAYSEVMVKVKRYQADGVPVVWLVDPATETVVTYTGDGYQPTQLDSSGHLEGEALLPGFRLALAALFAAA